PRKRVSPLGGEDCLRRQFSRSGGCGRGYVAMATGTIRSERLASAYYLTLGVLLVAAITLANPRAAANRIADALLSSSVFAPHAPTSLTATFRQGVSGYTGTVDTYIDAGFTTTSNATNVLLTTDGVPPANEERQTLIR